jgi:hypothetical protein
VFERLDEHSRRAMDVAEREARALDHNYLGTEHLVLGLASEDEAVAALLVDRGCGADDIRREILTLIGRGHPAAGRQDALLASLGIDLGEVRQRVEATFGHDATSRVASQTRPQRRWWPGQRSWPGCRDGTPQTSALLDMRSVGLAPRVKKVLDIAAKAALPGKCRRRSS